MQNHAKWRFCVKSTLQKTTSHIWIIIIAPICHFVILCLKHTVYVYWQSEPGLVNYCTKLHEKHKINLHIGKSSCKPWISIGSRLLHCTSPLRKWLLHALENGNFFFTVGPRRRDKSSFLQKQVWWPIISFCYFKLSNKFLYVK